VTRSHSAFLLAGFGFAPLVAGEMLSVGPSSKLVLAVLGVAAVFAAIRQLWRGTEGATAPLAWLLGLSLLGYVFWLIARWSAGVAWLGRISSLTGFAVPIGYFLLARSGRALARSRGDRSLERAWQACAWIGLPLLLLPNIFVVWPAILGFPGLSFESQNLLAGMGLGLVLSLPTVLLLHAVFATQQALTAASRRLVRLSLRLLAHPATAAAVVLLFLLPFLILVPSAIHFALTPSFDKFVAENRSAFSFDPPAPIRVLERHAGVLYASDGWIDIGMEDRETEAERLEYGFSLELKRPDATLLVAMISVRSKVEPASYKDFLGLRVASEITTIDPRFHLAVTVFLDNRTTATASDRAPVPSLAFIVQVALLAGTGDTTVETVLVDSLASTPLVSPAISAASLSYLWQSRGRFELVPSCRVEECLNSRVRYQQEQRFDLSTEEYSYAMTAGLTMQAVTRGPGARFSVTDKNDTKKKSQETSWNGVPW
jgi:hypothetical protein